MSLFLFSTKLRLTAAFPLFTFGTLFLFFDSVWYAQIAQLAEHVLGKDEVVGSNPILGSIRNQSLNLSIPHIQPSQPKWLKAHSSAPNRTST